MFIKYGTKYNTRYEKDIRTVINTKTNELFIDGNYILDENFNPVYLDLPQWEEYIKKAYDEKITLPFD